jgi:hypothetical protein
MFYTTVNETLPLLRGCSGLSMGIGPVTVVFGVAVPRDLFFVCGHFLFRLDAGKFGGAVLGLLLAYDIFYASNATKASANSGGVTAGSGDIVSLTSPSFSIPQPQPQPAQLKPPGVNEARSEKSDSSAHGNTAVGSCYCLPAASTKRKELAKALESDKDKGQSSATNIAEDYTSKEIRGLLRGLDVDLRGHDFSEKVIQEHLLCHYPRMNWTGIYFVFQIIQSHCPFAEENANC